ncbi:MAG: hypothetical protein ACTHMS_23510 [Jatrophihabitans sp.]|uniref:hypothetical protein n=1 Tax=Jatrophihabitans sp. TaxID=1932789 RepID=UPI003F80E0A0
MSTINVRLADCPTDVLVYLVDHGPATFDAVVAAVAPADAVAPRGKVSSALSLLVDMGCVRPDRQRGRAQGMPRLWRATPDGCSMVALAREGQPS